MSQQDAKSALLDAIPHLRAFAMSLCGNMDRADDLVQETLMKAWAHLPKLAKGSNIAAWLFTILRNLFYSDYRKRRREIADPDGHFAHQLASPPSQNAHMDFLDFQTAFQSLPPDQREALILVGASGLSYDEAATICGCATGTMKSRVNRARRRLAALLALKPGESFTEAPREPHQPATMPATRTD
jgi:RNA polymerase sigma-70 factor (ECF subfamily)